jgi:hypothetical protein
MRWSEDYHLFILGAVAFRAVLLGRATRRRRWSTPIDVHIIGMGVSYIAMLSTFYVDNGKNLPIWEDLPRITYWLLPSSVGLPLIVRALRRYPNIIPHPDGSPMAALGVSARFAAYQQEYYGIQIGRQEL